MPWPKSHKAETRQRIVAAAAEAFRARGVSAVRIDEIMAAAGLTHGGFYAHFSSKEELVGPALEHAGGQTRGMLSAVADPAAPEERLRAAVDAYLSPAHVAHPERGCPIAALGPELARAGGRTRRILAQGVRTRLAWMRSLWPARPGRAAEAPEDQLIGTLACMVGGVVLGRAVGSKDSEALLAACRRFLHAAVEAGAGASGERR